MNDKEKEKRGPEPILEAWMKSATKYWDTMSKTWPSDPEKMSRSFLSQADEMGKAKESMESAMRMWGTLSSAICDMESIESFCHGINSVPEILVKMTQSTWERFFLLQEQWMSKASKLGERTEAYTFDNLDQEAFSAWSAIYEEEFRKFFNVPQLGLTRMYQERANQFVDKFNLFQTAMSDFMRVLYLPMEKSLKVMQQKMEEAGAAGDVPHDYHEYYRNWIKTLEGHFMVLFKSPDYTQTLRKTLNAMGEYMIARHEFFQDILHTLPVPTDRDMDDLYKEMYELKKKLKKIEKNLAI
jgi:hypothetical protein